MEAKREAKYVTVKKTRGIYKEISRINGKVQLVEVFHKFDAEVDPSQIRKFKAGKSFIEVNGKLSWTKKAAQPKFSEKGRTWNKIEADIDGIETIIHLDTTLGHWAYYTTTTGEWRKFEHMYIEDLVK